MTLARWARRSQTQMGPSISEGRAPGPMCISRTSEPRAGTSSRGTTPYSSSQWRVTTPNTSILSLCPITRQIWGRRCLSHRACYWHHNIHINDINYSYITMHTHLSHPCKHNLQDYIQWCIITSMTPGHNTLCHPITACSFHVHQCSSTWILLTSLSLSPSLSRCGWSDCDPASAFHDRTAGPHWPHWPHCHHCNPWNLPKRAVSQWGDLYDGCRESCLQVRGCNRSQRLLPDRNGANVTIKQGRAEY